MTFRVERTRAALGARFLWQPSAARSHSQRATASARFRRTGQFVTERMPVADRFTPTLSRQTPYGYAVSAQDTSVLRVLGLHGILMFRTTRDWAGNEAEDFIADSTITAPRPFQNRREVRVEGRWVPRPNTSLPAGAIIVPVAQPLGVLAMYLLEPESDDGIVTWDIGDRSTSPPRMPVMRLSADPRIATQRWSPLLR